MFAAKWFAGNIRIGHHEVITITNQLPLEQLVLIHRSNDRVEAFVARVNIDERFRMFSISVTDEYSSKLLDLIQDGTIQELLRADALKEGLPL